jgi:hypothetical protein
MNKPTIKAPKVISWVEEGVPLGDIIKHAPWQVRAKLDDRAVKRYSDMTNAGSLPPPIKVARVGGKLFLVDGWHRMAAGALQVSRDLVAGDEVAVLMADMTKDEAAWEAAKANMGHGVPLNAKDLHAVFKAFVRAKRHVKPDGTLMSYRDIAPHIGKPHTTIRYWMRKYFPVIAAKMGGMENGNPEAGEPPLADAVEEHKAQALEGLLNLTQRLDLLTPEARWEVVQHLDKAREDAVKLGVKEPEPADFC